MRDQWFEWYEAALDNDEDTSFEAYQDSLFDKADLAIGEE